MAKDDMFVIMYKILAYLYACMKQGKKPDVDLEQLAGVNQPYYFSIIKELSEHGYVKGFRFLETKDYDLVIADNPRITMEGVEFLEENSKMHKAAKFLKEIKAVIPGL